jgi:hypothetical protein
MVSHALTCTAVPADPNVGKIHALEGKILPSADRQAFLQRRKLDAVPPPQAGHATLPNSKDMDPKALMSDSEAAERRTTDVINRISASEKPPKPPGPRALTTIHRTLGLFIDHRTALCTLLADIDTVHQANHPRRLVKWVQKTDYLIGIWQDRPT